MGAQAGNGVAGGVGAGDVLAGETPLVLGVGAGCGDGECHTGSSGLCGECNGLNGNRRCDHSAAGAGAA